jgi:hypothetical protein
MKVSELIERLKKYPDAEVWFICEAGCVRGEVADLIYEDDGLRKPRVFLADVYSSEDYDDDVKHGFHIP